MGQIAEDIINGECCALCGQYFVKPNVIDKTEYEVMSGQEIASHGMPVACKECFDLDCDYTRAWFDTFK